MSTLPGLGFNEANDEEGRGQYIGEAQDAL
jgi:hypothetical protein